MRTIWGMSLLPFLEPEILGSSQKMLLFFKDTSMKNFHRQSMETRISNTLRNIVELFQNGNVPQAIAIATFPRLDVPSSHWSLSNRLIMAKTGTSDARGLRAWGKVKRKVRKGEKAFYILAPRIIQQKMESDEDIVEMPVCVGFRTVPVFAIEQTEGQEMEYQKLQLPDLPLLERAKSWGIDIKAISFQGRFLGYYRPGEKAEIRLATPDEKTFFHELSHYAHSQISKQFKKGQHPRQEIVAELSAQTLAQLVGTQLESTLGNSYEYIRDHASRINKDVGVACLSVISEVEKVLRLILVDQDVQLRN